jgi:hypothetical protein
LSFPDLSEVLDEWADIGTKMIYNRRVTDYESQNAEETQEIVFRGTFEAVPERQMLVKPEGQRTWMWWRLLTTFDLNLGDIVKDPQGRLLRVMSAAEWKGSHNEYELTETTNSPT